MAAEATKRCSRCRLQKPPTEFYREAARADGRQNYCKACNRAALATPKRRAWRRTYRARPGVRARELAQERPRDQVRRQRSERRQAINAAIRAWKRTHPEQVRAEARRRRARKRGARVTLAELVEYEAVLRGDPCSYCGVGSNEIDHIEPLVAGGQHSAVNITAACGSCNRSKGTDSLLGFLSRTTEA